MLDLCSDLDELGVRRRISWVIRVTVQTLDDFSGGIVLANPAQVSWRFCKVLSARARQASENSYSPGMKGRPQRRPNGPTQAKARGRRHCTVRLEAK